MLRFLFVFLACVVSGRGAVSCGGAAFGDAEYNALAPLVYDSESVPLGYVFTASDGGQLLLPLLLSESLGNGSPGVLAENLFDVYCSSTVEGGNMGVVEVSAYGTAPAAGALANWAAPGFPPVGPSGSGFAVAVQSAAAALVTRMVLTGAAAVLVVGMLIGISYMIHVYRATR